MRADRPIPKPATPPVADYVGHLVKTRRVAVHGGERSARQVQEDDAARRLAANEAVISLLASRLHPNVRDDKAVRAFLDRHGPFNAESSAAILDSLLASAPADHHPTVYLTETHRQLGGAK